VLLRDWVTGSAVGPWHWALRLARIHRRTVWRRPPAECQGGSAPSWRCCPMTLAPDRIDVSGAREACRRALRRSVAQWAEPGPCCLAEHGGDAADEQVSAAASLVDTAPRRTPLLAGPGAARHPRRSTLAAPSSSPHR